MTILFISIVPVDDKIISNLLLQSSGYNSFNLFTHIQEIRNWPVAVMTIRSVKILLVCNTDFFGKLAKIGQYLVIILGNSQYI